MYRRVARLLHENLENKSSIIGSARRSFCATPTKCVISRDTVRKGDNLTAIARKQGCSVDELKSWNNLKTERIYPGQTLKVRKR